MDKDFTLSDHDISSYENMLDNAEVTPVEASPSPAVLAFIKQFARSYRPAFDSDMRRRRGLSASLPGYVLS